MPRDPADSSAETSARPALSEGFGDFAGRFTPGLLLAGRYRIIAPLGHGGMGEVYRADDMRLGQPVALKFIPAALAFDPGRLARLVDEVRIGRQIAHPNVCRLYDIAEADGPHFLVMAYVDGEDLASLLRRIGRLPGDKALDLARGLCAGLAAAHDKGVIHRDLKPVNVMVDGRTFSVDVPQGEASRWPKARLRASHLPQLPGKDEAARRGEEPRQQRAAWPWAIARYLAAAGELTEVPRRAPGRGPPYWTSQILRRQALGDDSEREAWAMAETTAARASAPSIAKERDACSSEGRHSRSLRSGASRQGPSKHFRRLRLRMESSGPSWSVSSRDWIWRRKPSSSSTTAGSSQSGTHRDTEPRLRCKGGRSRSR